MPPVSSGKFARIYLNGEVFFMSAVLVESQRQAQNATYRSVVRAGEPWLREIRQGAYLRIVDLEGNQAVDTLFYNAHDYRDRYSAQDTIREQRNIYLTNGTRLMSTGGSVLLTMVADTCGRHDTLGGACAAESNMVRYSLEKRFMHACRQSFLQAIVDWDHGMDKRDITHNINFFMNVPVTPDSR